MRQYLLKNGNKPFDLTTCKLCGAKNRQGNSCKAKAMKNGRCRLHGGKSTGAKTKEGKQRRNRANYKHGLYASDMLYTRALMTQSRRIRKILCREVKESDYRFTWGEGMTDDNVFKFSYIEEINNKLLPTKA